MKTVYLCGPINGRSDADCKDWREAFKALWRDCLDPMRRNYRGREMEPGINAEIVEGDEDDIRASALLLVFFDKPSVGTAMEIRMAKKELGLPVVVIDASGKPLSPWLTYHTDRIVSTVEQAHDAIKELLC
jgi:hypothetical protein